jgi:LEA14-like dessication related protein
MKRGVLVMLCTFLASACAVWGLREPLNVTIADLKPLEIGVLEQRYVMKVRLLNPNDTEIAFDGVVFDLQINDMSFAKGVSDQRSVIPRFGEALIEVQVVSGLQNILRQVNDLLKGDRTAVTYRIKGRLHLDGGIGSVPFDSRGEFVFPAGAGKTGS